MAKWTVIAAVLLIALAFVAVTRYTSTQDSMDATSNSPVADPAEQSATGAVAGQGSNAESDARSPQIYEWDATTHSGGAAGGTVEPPKTTVGIAETMKSTSLPVIDPDELPPEARTTGSGPSGGPSASAASTAAILGPPPQGYVVDTSGPPPELSNEVLPGPAVESRDPLATPGDTVGDGSDMISPDLPGPGPGSGAVDPPGLGPGETPDGQH